jgi:invasion protein IalB
MCRLPGFLLVVAFCLPPLIAMGQTQKGAVTATDGPATKSAATPVPATPERTAASFGDWLLRCDGIVAPPRRVCEVAYMIVAQGQTAPVAQIAIGKQAPGERERLTVVVPPNIAIGVRPYVATSKAGAAPFELTWQRCLPGACFASAEISSAAISELAAQSEPGRIVFRNAADRDTALPLSFRGLSQAMAALAKEP